jgi:TrmH family RNA methyltransferase
MPEKEVIRSRSNALLKRVGSVIAGMDKSTVVLEGDRMVDEALEARWDMEAILVAEDREERIAGLEAVGQHPRAVDGDLLARVGSLKGAPGILALCPCPPVRDVAELDASPRSLCLVVWGVADPGNLGALARSAEAAGASALLVGAGGVSPWHPAALRGSMGSLLRLPVYGGHSAETIYGILTRKGFRQVRASTRGGVAPMDQDWEGPIALWVGGETGSFPTDQKGQAFEDVTIPTAGGTESLNVTVAGSLLLFSAGRVENGPS